MRARRHSYRLGEPAGRAWQLSLLGQPPREPGTTTFMTPAGCVSSEDCETGGNCVAPYDPMPAPGAATGGQSPPHETAACIDTCIGENNLGSWCTDDASCCAPLRCNAVDGFCEPVGGGPDSTDGTGSTGTTGTGTGSTGTSTSAGSGASETTVSDDSGASTASSGTSGSGTTTGPTG